MDSKKSLPTNDYRLSTTKVIIYQAEGQAVEVRLDAGGNTVWLTQAQMVSLFGRDQSVVSRHISNIFKEGELERESNMQKMHIANSDKPVDLYNLDIIISVGYRVKSVQGTRFRQWATRILREHLTRGWTLDQQRFAANASELEAALSLVRGAAQSPALSTDGGRGLVEIVTRYTQTFLLLQRYDEGLLTEPRAQTGGKLPSAKEARAALAGLMEGNG